MEARQPRKVLADHKKRGRLFVPPFTASFGPIQEVSWVKTLMPELLWIALIQYGHGEQRGVELVTSISRAARAEFVGEQRRTFAPASDYERLSEQQWGQVRDALSAKGALTPIQEAIKSLVSWYPQCPLRHAFSVSASEQSSADDLQRIKDVVASLYNKRDRGPMMVQASAVWLAFDSEMLKVVEGLALAQFPEIERYPETELSRKVASGIRATLSILMANDGSDAGSSPWPTYFWNRSLEISPCEFADER